MAIDIEGALKGIKIHKLPKDSNFSKDRLTLAGDPHTGKLYQVEANDWANILSGLGVAYKGSAVPTTDPGTPSSPVFYSASDEGTYTSFKDSNNTALEIDSGDGLVILSFDGTAWSKQTLSISGSLVAKADIINNLTSNDTDKPLAASQGSVLNNKIQIATQFGTLTDITGAKGNYKIDPTNGLSSNDNSYEGSDFIAVTPGEVIYYSGSVLGKEADGTARRGMAGYSDANENSFVTDENDEGFAIGKLLDPDILYTYYDIDYTENGYRVLDNFAITIPEGVNYIRASSYNNGTSYSAPLLIKGETFPGDSETVKDKINDLEERGSGIKKDFMYGKQPDNVSYGEYSENKSVYPPEFTFTRGSTGIKSYLAYFFDDNEILASDNIYVAGYLKQDVADSIQLSLAMSTGDISNPTLLDRTYEEIGSDGVNDWYFIVYKFQNNHKDANYFWLQFNNLSDNSEEQYNVYWKGFTVSTVLVSETDNFIHVHENDNENDFDELEEYNNKIASVCQAYTTNPSAQYHYKNRFNFIHFSDVHYGASASQTPQENLKQMLDFIGRDDMNFLDAVMFTGDACQGLSDRDQSKTLAELNSYKTDMLECSLPVLNLKGNHDDNANMIVKDFGLTTALTDAELYDILFSPFENKFSSYITGVTDKCYYYADFATYKIRVIALNNYSLPRVDNGSGKSKYDVYGSYYTQEQIDWLYTSLNNTPNDYNLIVLNHGSLLQGYDFSDYPQGYDFIPSVINAWKNGSTYNHNYENQNFSELNTTKNFDFTSRGTGNFVCYLSGHTHALEILKGDTFPDQNHIIVPCLKTSSSINRNSWNDKKHTMMRSQNIELKSAFNVIGVDTLNGIITVTHYGPYRDTLGEYDKRTHFISYK